MQLSPSRRIDLRRPRGLCLAGLVVILFLTVPCAAPGASWARAYGGASQDDNPWSVHETAEGGFLVVGHGGTFAGGDWDVQILKTDPDGEIEWLRSYGGPEADTAYAATLVPGGVVVAGGSKSFGGAWALLVGPSGDIVRQRRYSFDGAEGEEWGVPSSIRRTSDGGVILAGTGTTAGAWALKLAVDGTVEWQGVYPLGDVPGCARTTFSSIVEAEDGGFLAVGSVDDS